MSDIHALSGAYAVDALDDIERDQFEQHLTECPECRAEVSSFRETTALLAETEAVPAPTSLRNRVLAEIGRVRPLPPEPAKHRGESQFPTEDESTSPVAVLRRRRLPQLVAGAPAVVLLAVGALTWHPWEHDRATLADRILHAPDAVELTEKLPGGNGQITLVRSASLDGAVMIADQMPDPAPGKTYQMWLQQPGRGMVSAGLMPDADRPTVVTGDLASATAAAVSIEPAGGSAQPTKAIALFPLKADASGNGAA
jgi:anti-sigma-K factor RskA